MTNELKDKFINYLKYELNYSDYTIKEYLMHINKYFVFLKKENIDFKNIDKPKIIEFLKYLDNQKLSNATIANILSSLRTFYNYLLDEKIISNNVFRLIKNPKLEKKLPNFLSQEQMRMILDSIKLETELDYRNKLIIELLYASGIRVSELVNIQIKDINKIEKSIRIMGKGKKERIVYYGSYAERAMDEYLNKRTKNSEYLIINNLGNNITTRGVEKIVDKVVKECLINNKVSPHTFRHTFATHLLNNGADIKSVQELLGHSSLNTTEKYTHITSDFLKSEYLKSMPRK